MKVVFDVGQFVSAVIAPKGYPAQLLEAWKAGTFELVTSPAILADLRRVLKYPRIRKYHKLSDEEIEENIQSIAHSVVLTSGKMTVSVVVDDPTDNKIIACAIEGGTDYIVSSDVHLAKLGTYRGIPILSPRQLLEQLRP